MSALPTVDGCGACRRLAQAAEHARAVGDRSLETDCVVLLGRHAARVHLGDVDS